jgi:hypothetical protein
MQSDLREIVSCLHPQRVSALMPNACSKRSAMLAVRLAWPLSRTLMFWRLTPRRAATSVTVKLKRNTAR